MKAPCVVDTKSLMKKGLEKRLRIKIIDIMLHAGYWYALIPSQESDEDDGWVLVTDLLKRPKFTIRSEGKSAFDGRPALYLLD